MEIEIPGREKKLFSYALIPLYLKLKKVEIKWQQKQKFHESPLSKKLREEVQGGRGEEGKAAI